MQPFEYSSALDTQSAAANFAEASAYLAGGTTLMDLMKLHVMTPSHVIDITRLPLNQVSDLGDQIEVGAMVTNNDLAHHNLIKTHLLFVSEALLSGASVQLRNLATTSGNILQKTRCAYFRDPNSKCNKRDPGTGCDALHGVNRMQAILGTSEHCIAANPSDFSVALMAAGAVIKTKNKRGERQIPIQEFYTLPSDQPQVETVLEAGEIITSILIPKKPFFKRSTYVKIRDRSSYAFALSSAAVAIEMKNGKVENIAIAMGGIGTIPWRATDSEKALIGKPLTEHAMQFAAKVLVKNAVARTYNAFKIPLAEQTLIRALKEVELKS